MITLLMYMNICLKLTSSAKHASSSLVPPKSGTPSSDIQRICENPILGKERTMEILEVSH